MKDLQKYIASYLGLKSKEISCFLEENLTSLDNIQVLNIQNIRILYYKSKVNSSFSTVSVKVNDSIFTYHISNTQSYNLNNVEKIFTNLDKIDDNKSFANKKFNPRENSDNQFYNQLSEEKRIVFDLKVKEVMNKIGSIDIIIFEFWMKKDPSNMPERLKQYIFEI